MATGLITKRLVDAAIPGERDVFIWDRDVSGFGLKVTPQGKKTYVLQYRLGGRGTATRRYTIGRHGSPWTPDGARQEARSLLEEVRRGTDPIESKRDRLCITTGHPFDQYLERFLELYGREHWRPRTYDSAKSNLRRYVLPFFKSKSLAAITRADLIAVFDALPRRSPALSRSVYAQTRKLFTWATGRGDLSQSPFDGMRSPPQIASRDRVLTDAELGLIWRASNDVAVRHGAFVRLLMLTGQRRDEVAGMAWQEVDRRAKTWTISANRSKNGVANVVSLPRAVRRELTSICKGKWPSQGFVFAAGEKSYISSFSATKRQLDEAIEKIRVEGRSAAPVTSWRFHDLRRTFATGMQRLGVRFEVTEALLNHVSGSRSGVAGVYQRHEWADEKRMALNAWADHIAEISRRSSLAGR